MTVIRIIVIMGILFRLGLSIKRETNGLREGALTLLHV